MEEDQKKKDNSAQQKPGQQEERAADGGLQESDKKRNKESEKGSGSGRRQEMEASADLGAEASPAAEGQDSPSGKEAPSPSAAAGDGAEAAQEDSGGAEGAAGDHEGNSAAAGTGGDNGGNSAAGLGEDGEVSGGEASAGATDAPEPGEEKTEAADSSATDSAGADGEADPDSGQSADDEEDSTGGSIKGFFSSLFGDDAGPEQGDDEAGSENEQRQEIEAADELGAQEQGQDKSHKGFFARLFGEDEESEEDGDMPGGVSPSGQPEKPENSRKSASGKAEPGQGKKPADQPEDPMQKKRDQERSDSLEASIKYWQGDDKIPDTLEDTKKTLTEVLGLGSSFDIVFREMSFAGRRAALLCVSGFAKDTIIDEILKRLTYLTPDRVSADVFASFMTEYIPHVQVEKGELLSESIYKVLSGMSVFFIEGETQVIIMDTRSYPSRSPDEPSIERVVRGARDGFTETLLSNVALVRRRVRDPGLKLEMHQIGRRTRTDVCVAYIDDIVDKTQVQAVTDKLKSVNLDGIPLADKQLEEAIVGGGWNPYPLVRYSERPDIVASHLLEGRVVVFVDTSPSVMVLPTTFFDLCQHAEENRQTPFMGTYLRWVRFIGIFASMFLLPLWMLLVIHPELKPPMLDFIGPQKMAKIPLIAQFLIVELGVDLLRMAAVHTPTPLGSAMGLIAAILVGDIAVQTGLFVNEVVLYMAVAAIGMFATPSYELGLANRIVRLGLLLAVAAFQIPGFMIGSTLLIVLLTTHRSYNSPYMWPFIPFNAKAMAEIITRMPVLSSKTRPSFNKTRDNTRMPAHKGEKRKS